MPPAAAVVAAAAIAGLSAGLAGVTIAGSAILGGLLIGALSLAVSIGGMLLAKKPEISNLSSFSARAQNRTQQVRQPITARRVVYGDVRVSGPLVHIESTGGNNKNLLLVLVLAPHRVKAIDTVYLNSDPIFPDDLDEAGAVVSGKYANLVVIRKHLGEVDQAADSDLVDRSAIWTTDHRLRGCAYVYVVLQFDREVFPSSIPNIAADVQGRDEIVDPRDSGTRFTDNAALILRDYLTQWYDGGWGNAWSESEIDDSFANAAANVCDEFVPTVEVSHSVETVNIGSGSPVAGGSLDLDGEKLKLQRGDAVRLSTSGTLPSPLATETSYYVIPVRRVSTSDKAVQVRLASSHANALAGTALTITDSGSGTVTLTRIAEPRYSANGVIEMDQAPEDTMADLLTAMGGRAIYAGGAWRLHAAAYRAAAVTLDEDDLRGPIRLQTRISRQDRFNAVKGVFVTSLNDGQPADYPAVTGADYVTADGGQIFRELDLPFTNRSNTAQRLAKIEMERGRREISVQAQWSLKALQVQCGDTVAVTNGRFGWTSKPFEVTSWKIASQDVDGVPALVVEMDLRETELAVFGFNALAEERAYAAPPRTTLPDPFTVAAPTGLALSTITYLTDTGTKVSRIKIQWTAAADFFVTNGGRYEIQFKASAVADWEPSWFADGEQTRSSTPPVEDSVNYDLRIRAFNHLGVPSSYSSVFGYTVGSPGAGATLQIDDGLITDPPTELVDMGGIAATVDKTLEDGSITG